MSHDLVIPIYIDTNALLDLLASIEGGFSAVEKITTQNSNSKNAGIEGKLDAGTEFGIPNVLNLLKVTIGLVGKSASATSASIVQETERYHTYGSLFYRLREYLADNNLLVRIEDKDSWNSINASSFVEIHGVIQSNPLVAALQRLDKIITIAEFATSFGTQNTSAGQRKTKPQKGANKRSSTTTSQIRGFLQGLLNDLQNEQVRLFVVDSTGQEEFRAVLTLFVEYLRDKTMLEINNKEYYILGKVVRKIEAGEQETIDLLAGTGLGGIDDTMLHTLLDGLKSIPNIKLTNEIKTKISGAALEVVPIAIFV